MKIENSFGIAKEVNESEGIYQNAHFATYWVNYKELIDLIEEISVINVKNPKIEYIWKDELLKELKIRD